MKNNTLKLILPVALLAGAAGGWSAPATEQAAAQRITRAVQEKAAQANQEQALAQKAGLLQVQAVWERCEIKEYRNRGARIWGGPRKLRIPWNCHEVRTECAAVEANGHLLVPAACFYAEEQEDERIQLTGAMLVQANGAKRSVLGYFQGKAKDFAVFTLK